MARWEFPTTPFVFFSLCIGSCSVFPRPSSCLPLLAMDSFHAEWLMHQTWKAHRAGHSVQTGRGIGRRGAMPPSWFLEPCNVGRTAIHLGWPSSTIATQAEEYIHWFHVTKKPKLYWLGISWMKVLQVFNKDMRFLLGLSACHHLSWALANYWKAAVHFRGNVI